MAKNSNLSKAKTAKNDEFYTQLSDVEKELKHYKEHFKDKIVFCNCDDPEWSAFWKYFHLNFNHLGLKKLISTHYVKEVNTENTLFNINPDAFSYKMEYTGENDEDISVGVKTKLNGNGDFRSDECIELLKECDIVVSNPPFSLFREYVAQLMEYNKKFLIIGNKNAITYKEFFPLLKDNKVWMGCNNVSEFMEPSGEIKKFGNIAWFTNLDIKKRHEKLILWKNYTTEEFPTYDNYDAINVDKVADIPVDYEGVMGVPITFLDKYNPEQFEIIGFSQGDLFIDVGGEGVSERIVKDYYAQGNKGQISVGWKHIIYYDKNGKVIAPYQRILIRKKKGGK
jgi:hypothetical protein